MTLEDKLPPTSTGHRVVKELKYKGGVWMRLEYVPCNKKDCNKDPDEHGPWWYRYEEFNGKWRQRYLGSEEPIHPLPSYQEVADELEPLIETKDLLSISDDEVEEIRKFRALLFDIEGEEAKGLSERAAVYLVDVYSARDNWYDKRYRELSQKINLTKEEQKEMAECAEILSSSH